MLRFLAQSRLTWSVLEFQSVILVINWTANYKVQVQYDARHGLLSPCHSPLCPARPSSGPDGTSADASQSHIRRSQTFPMSPNCGANSRLWTIPFPAAKHLACMVGENPSMFSELSARSSMASWLSHSRTRVSFFSRHCFLF